MYESFFGLKKRPYAAAPDVEMSVETPAVADAIERLDRCVRQGRGIGVLTAAAGMGKTHLCHRLARRWAGDFQTVVLANAGFPTRRGLLQSVLAELGQPFQRSGEIELRLELTAAARAARNVAGGVVLIFDEAHRHSERVLEEIRLIANLIDGGEPLVRVVLAGQLELEERLADPASSGLNERVGELVTLPRLTAEESRFYLAQRATAAGGSVGELFEPAAVEVIVQACGGVPRCLNQLADHGLLLGYVAERRPVDEGLVREALDDLKRLPLHWHDPLPTAEPASQEGLRDIEDAPAAFGDVIEIGGLGDEAGFETRVAEASAEQACSECVEFGHEEPASRAEPISREDLGELLTTLPRPAMETIADRFARLDAADAHRRWEEFLRAEEEGRADRRPATAVPARAVEARPTPNPLEILDQIEPLIAEALAEGAEVLTPVRGVREIASSGNSIDLEVQAFELTAEEIAAVTGESRREEPETPSSVGGRQEAGARRTVDAARPGVRQSTLFSDLRRRRREAAAQGER